MAKDIMTIRFTPDGFSFTECPTSDSVLLDEAAFHDVAPGPDFQHRLQEAVLNAIPIGEDVPDVRCQIVSSRVVLLPPDITDADEATQMYEATMTPADDPEQVLFEPITLSTGQQLGLCYGIDHSLYLFLQRNYGELSFEHHIATLLETASRMVSGNCLVVRCDGQWIELALFRDKQLTMVNVYRTSLIENRTYYVMNTWLQAGLDQLRDSLLVLSRGNEGLQVRASLHRFIKHVFA